MGRSQLKYSRRGGRGRGGAGRVVESSKDKQKLINSSLPSNDYRFSDSNYENSIKSKNYINIEDEINPGGTFGIGTVGGYSIVDEDVYGADTEEAVVEGTALSINLAELSKKIENVPLKFRLNFSGIEMDENPPIEVENDDDGSSNIKENATICDIKNVNKINYDKDQVEYVNNKAIADHDQNEEDDDEEINIMMDNEIEDEIVTNDDGILNMLMSIDVSSKEEAKPKINSTSSAKNEALTWGKTDLGDY